VKQCAGVGAGPEGNRRKKEHKPKSVTGNRSLFSFSSFFYFLEQCRTILSLSYKDLPRNVWPRNPTTELIMPLIMAKERINDEVDQCAIMNAS
jgi:hypothetical protein